MNDLLAANDKPLLQRKLKPIAKEEFEREFKNLVKDRYAAIKEVGKSIHSMIKDANKMLRVPNNSYDWKAYVDFINNVVVEGLSQIIRSSLVYLYEQIDVIIITKEEKYPMIEIKLDLISIRNGSSPSSEEEVHFIPELTENGGKGIRDLINNVIGSFFNVIRILCFRFIIVANEHASMKVSTLFKRLDIDGSFLREMHSDQKIKMLLAQINESLADNEDKCLELKAFYDNYSYLWATDLVSYFAKFKEDAQIITENGQALLDLVKFEEALSKYEDTQKSIHLFQSPVDIGTK